MRFGESADADPGRTLRATPYPIAGVVTPRLARVAGVDGSQERVGHVWNLLCGEPRQLQRRHPVLLGWPRPAGLTARSRPDADGPASLRHTPPVEVAPEDAPILVAGLDHIAIILVDPTAPQDPVDLEPTPNTDQGEVEG